MVVTKERILRCQIGTSKNIKPDYLRIHITVNNSSEIYIYQKKYIVTFLQLINCSIVIYQI